MNNLESIRKEIDKIDQEMATLYEKRMNLMKEVAEYKKDNNLKINDPIREKEVIEHNSNRIKTEKLKKPYQDFIQFIMDQGKELQNNFLN